ncbi:MAG TPA: DEAD/DEAH box helicase [Patescibacteria group bacterium]
MNSPKIDLNPQFQQAITVLEQSSNHAFITGRAGTGKSTLLDFFRTRTDKNTAVLAPTGVAALNVEGETIHSFFRFKPGLTVDEAKQEAQRVKQRRELYRALELLIIDEISMVRADLLDCMNVFLQAVRHSHLPFGGVRLICFGDLHQLPPVMRREEQATLSQVYDSPYFFGSHAFAELNNQLFNQLDFIELETVYRQKDAHFIELLNAIRDKQLTDEILARLNERVIVDNVLESLADTTIVLTATNAQADAINSYKLNQLSGESSLFEGDANGAFERSSYPTDEEVLIKSGARVMMVNNDRNKQWVNGSVGTVMEVIRHETKAQMKGLMVMLDDGGLVDVWPHTWEMSRSYFDPATQAIQREVVGSYTQIPVRLAWAVTIHKSQGKTFDKVVVDLGRGAFAAGQTYVALSRCRTLEGLQLAQPLRARDVQLDSTIVTFLQALRKV